MSTHQDKYPPTRGSLINGDSSKSYVLSGKIMLTSILVLFAVVVFLILLHLYSRWYLLRARRRHHQRRSRRHRPTHLVFYVDPNGGTAAPSGGLDASVLKSIPVFVYSSESRKDMPECAVCLSEFEENETGRVLPNCGHSFHTECIDMWFQSHSTCPLCRSVVEAVVAAAEPENTPIASPEPGSSSEVAEGSEMASLADRRKGLDVRIEVPRRELEEEFRLPSPASFGFRSPGSRLMSLKRILSMSMTAVSPSSGVGPSCVAVGTESDIESARDCLTPVVTRASSPR